MPEEAAAVAEAKPSPAGELICEAPMVFVRYEICVKGKPPFHDALFFTPEEYAKQAPWTIAALARGRFAEREEVLAKMLAEGVVAPEESESKA